MGCIAGGRHRSTGGANTRSQLNPCGSAAETAAAICWPAAYPAISQFFGVYGPSILMVCFPSRQGDRQLIARCTLDDLGCTLTGVEVN
jgi:hypothetical protein